MWKSRWWWHCLRCPLPPQLPVSAEDKVVSCKPLMEQSQSYQSSAVMGGSEVVLSQGGPILEPNMKLMQHGMESSAVRPVKLESGQQAQTLVTYPSMSHSYLNTGHLAPQAPPPLQFLPTVPPESGSPLPSQLTTPTLLHPPPVAPPLSS